MVEVSSRWVVKTSKRIEPDLETIREASAAEACDIAALYRITKHGSQITRRTGFHILVVLFVEEETTFSRGSRGGIGSRELGGRIAYQLAERQRAQEKVARFESIFKLEQ